MDSKRVFVEGVVAGVLGYFVVAGFFAAVNALAGASPFQTALLLGDALGARRPEPGQVAGVILAANGVHLVISLAVGIAAAWLVAEVEHHHALWYAILLALLGGFFLSIVAAGVLAAEVAGVVTWPQIAAANTLAALVIGGYLWRMHRDLVRELRQEMEAGA